MAWIELHQSLPTHRKTLAVADTLDLPPVYILGHMTAFWLWALDNVPDGRLHKVSPRTLARAAQWTGEPGAFLDAITDAGFLDPDGDDLLIHDWWAYAGKLIDRREENAKRMRDARALHVRSTSAARASTQAPPRADTCGATVPNPTQPNSTEPKRSLEALFDSPTPQAPLAPIEEKPKPKRVKKPSVCEKGTEPYRLTELIVGRLFAMDPGMNLPEPGSARFAGDAKKLGDLLLRRTPAQIEAVIDWSTTDACWWATRLTSVSFFVNHFDAMYRQMSEPKRATYSGNGSVNRGDNPGSTRKTPSILVNLDDPELWRGGGIPPAGVLPLS